MLNALQTQILDATFDYVFATITDENIPVEVGLKALNAITDNAIFTSNQESFSQYQLVEVIQQIRKVYDHEYPQNRSVGSPYVGQESGWVAWEPNGHGNGVERERIGLLGLTAHNNNQTTPVTKADVVSYLNNCIEQHKNRLRGRLPRPEEVTPQPARETVSAIRLFAYMQATVGMFESFKNEIKFYRNLDSNAATTYATTVLNILRKGLLEDFKKDPLLFAIPPQLKEFIQLYLKEHPILLEAKTYEKHTKKLEKLYIEQGSSNISQYITTETSHSPVTTPFWNSPSTATSRNCNIKDIVQAVCDLVERLIELLRPFTHLNPQAAKSWVSTLIAAIRKNQVNEIFYNSELFGIPKEVKDILTKEFEHFPILLNLKTLGEESKKLEVALNAQTINDIRLAYGLSTNANNTNEINQISNRM